MHLIWLSLKKVANCRKGTCKIYHISRESIQSPKSFHAAFIDKFFVGGAGKNSARVGVDLPQEFTTSSENIFTITIYFNGKKQKRRNQSKK